jgi:hypothetical protein
VWARHRHCLLLRAPDQHVAYRDQPCGYVQAEAAQRASWPSWSGLSGQAVLLGLRTQLKQVALYIW